MPATSLAARLARLRAPAFLVVMLLGLSALFGSLPPGRAASGTAVYLRSTVGAPFGVSSNETAMNRVFGAGNWQDLRYETVGMASLLAPVTSFIYMEGSDSNATELEAFLGAHASAIQDWVAAGGTLFLNAAPNEDDGMSFGFGVTLAYRDFTNNAVAVDPAHPLFNGPFTPVGTAWTGNAFAHGTVSGGGITSLIQNPFTGRSVLAEKTYGAGHVLFGGLVPDTYQNPKPQTENLRANLIAYAVSFYHPNQPPSAADQSVSTDEDTPVGVHLGGADPNGDPLAYRILTQPAHGTLTGTVPDLTYTPALNYHGPDRFTFSASDGTEESGAATVSIAVRPVNDPPGVTADRAAVAVDEGSTAINTGTWSDADGDPTSLTASRGAVIRNGDGTWSWAVFAADGPGQTGPVTVNADDGNGGTGAAGFSLTVRNIAPAVAAGPDAAAEAGQTFSGTGAFSDPGADSWTATVNYGDGAGPQPLALEADRTFRLCHRYGASGVYRVCVRVTDDDGGAGADDLTVSVRNGAPAVTAPADQAASEGTPAAFTLGGFSDSAGDGPWNVTVRWGDGTTTSGTQSGTGNLASQAHAYADDGTYAAAVTVTDRHGASGSAAFQVRVANLAPTAALLGPAPGAVFAVNTPVSLGGRIADPGPADTHDALWTLSGAPGGVPFTTSLAGSVNAADRTVTGSCTFTVPGTYFLKLTVTDDDGASGEVARIGGLPACVVVYDPLAGFVTGEGWIAALPAGQGKASFDFSARYRPEAAVPEGRTEFRVGTLCFRSTCYRWLTVAGGQAQVKGEGTVNGRGSYGFVLTAVDGQVPGGVADRLRIRIWDRASGVTVYDNQPGTEDTAAPGARTVLGGGNIRLHTR